MKCRKNVRALTVGEKRDFVNACKGLKTLPSVLHPGSQSRYDDYVEVHLDAMNSFPNWGHGDRAFLPWHRELLWHFEKDLQSVVPGVRIPYWDWTRHQSTSDPGFPFTNDLLGRDGDPGDGNRVKRDPAVALNADGSYPFAFDPDTWSIVVKDSPLDPSFLTRAFGTRADAPGLPDNDATVTGTNTSFRQAITATSYAGLRSRAEDLHNLVHRWVNGAMITASSPNDMVFWLHHAVIDRMWTLWQKRNPALAPYVGSATPGHGLTDTMIYHDPGQPAPWTGSATPQQMIEGHAIHGDGVWYDTDLPEITLDSSPSLAFGAVPAGLTTFRAVRFRVQACRTAKFRITAQPTGNFGLTPMGTEFTAEPDEASDFVYGYVWVQFQATGATSQSSAVTVQAYVIDDEGYYAPNEGDEVALGSWTVTLTAEVVSRANNAVVMVLDRSGSMSAGAGGTSTRSSLLKSAVGAFHALMLPDDEIGVVSFDDLIETPVPLTTQSAGLGTLLTGTALDPRGQTAIGQGIQTASPLLAGSSHTNRSMLVLTDGNENVHPYVDELPAGTITNRTFSIGFGLPGQVSDQVLSAVAGNTNGFFAVTGNLATDEQRFLLTKHFLQVLSGATNTNIIIDPQGELGAGDTQAVDFDVAGTDVAIDVIGLCPAAQLLDFELHTPGGQVITPATAAAEPNVRFVVQREVAFYRIMLPALPAAAAGSHAGRWQAVFRLAKADQIKQWLAENREGWAELVGLRQRGRLPYSCLAHTWSNLDFKVTLTQTGFVPGSQVKLEATLTEYGVPLAGAASVWAEITRPDGLSQRLSFQRQAPGHYGADYGTVAAGIYSFRVRAAGSTSAGDAFTREALRTAGLFAGRGGDGTRDRLDGLVDLIRERDERLCRLLACLTGRDVLGDDAVKRLRATGIDLDGLRKCVEQWCAEAREPQPPRAARPITAAPSAEVDKLVAELMGRLAMVDPAVLFQPTPEPQPIPRPSPRAKKHRAHPPAGGHFPPVKPEDEGPPPAASGKDHEAGRRPERAPDRRPRDADSMFPPVKPEDEGPPPANNRKRRKNR